MLGSQGLLSFSSCQAHGKLGGDTAGTGDPTNQRDILGHMISYSVYKAGGRRRKGGTFRVLMFVFPSNHYAQRNPVFVGMAEHLPVKVK